jgi:hypothetical protein
MGALSERGALAGRSVGVYGSGGAPYPHLAYAALHGAAVRPVRAEDVLAGRLERLDALVMPGGGLRAMAGLLAPLGSEGAARIRRFVEDGGLYVSSCAGSVLPLALAGAAAELHPEAAAMRMVEAPLANPGDATLGGLASPGVGRIRVRLDPASPLAEGLPQEVELVHYNGPFFAVDEAAPAPTPFAWPVAAEEGFTPAERFLPAEAGATTFDACLARGAAGGAVARVGAGRAVVFGSHPEFGLGPLQLGWGAGARLLRNALALAPARGRDPGGTGPWVPRPDRPETSVATLAAEGAEALRTLAAGFARLPDRADSGWLDPEVAPSFHGRTARELWRRDAAAAADVAGRAAELAERLAPALDEADRGWLDDAPRRDQDVGAMGLRQLVARAASMRDRAEARLDDPPTRPAHAYDGLDASPFHLAVGTYLSAAGLVAAAALALAAIAARHGRPPGPLATVLEAGAAEARP